MLIPDLIVRPMMMCLWRHYCFHEIYQQRKTMSELSEWILSCVAWVDLFLCFYELYYGLCNYWPGLNITAALEQKLQCGSCWSLKNLMLDRVNKVASLRQNKSIFRDRKFDNPFTVFEIGWTEYTLFCKQCFFFKSAAVLRNFFMDWAPNFA